MTMTIGSKIKNIRELKKLTQEQLADKLGMSVQGLGKLERDESDIPYSRIEQIAKAFNMRTEDLICFDEKQTFYNYGEIKGHQFSTIHNSHSEQLEKLYEDKVKLVEDKLKLQEDRINHLQESIQFLKELIKK